MRSSTSDGVEKSGSREMSNKQEGKMRVSRGVKGKGVRDRPVGAERGVKMGKTVRGLKDLKRAERANLSHLQIFLIDVGLPSSRSHH